MDVIKFFGDSKCKLIVRWLFYMLMLSLKIYGIISSSVLFATVIIVESLLIYLECKSIKNSKLNLHITLISWISYMSFFVFTVLWGGKASSSTYLVVVSSIVVVSIALMILSFISGRKNIKNSQIGQQK